MNSHLSPEAPDRLMRRRRSDPPYESDEEQPGTTAGPAHSRPNSSARAAQRIITGAATCTAGFPASASQSAGVYEANTSPIEPTPSSDELPVASSNDDPLWRKERYTLAALDDSSNSDEPRQPVDVSQSHERGRVEDLAADGGFDTLGDLARLNHRATGQ
ncbi:hypothetical protein RHCRD62_10296 [Rhodococcus sp. RD6.2]|nr:hypothetical protein RHCRD62_10296 [Rhodococcus sp. RD6.2]